LYNFTSLILHADFFLYFTWLFLKLTVFLAMAYYDFEEICKCRYDNNKQLKFYVKWAGYQHGWNEVIVVTGSETDMNWCCNYYILDLLLFILIPNTSIIFVLPYRDLCILMVMNNICSISSNIINYNIFFFIYFHHLSNYLNIHNHGNSVKVNTISIIKVCTLHVDITCFGALKAILIMKLKELNKND
jgi:hypothetical protein